MCLYNIFSHIGDVSLTRKNCHKPKQMDKQTGLYTCG